MPAKLTASVLDLAPVFSRYLSIRPIPPSKRASISTSTLFFPSPQLNFHLPYSAIAFNKALVASFAPYLAAKSGNVTRGRADMLINDVEKLVRYQKNPSLVI